MDLINYGDFEKVDIRVGTVTKAEVPEWSHWVVRLEIEFGDEIGKKICFSGIMKFYKPEDLEGKQFPFVINLEPKKIGPDKELSEVMMIMACPQLPEQSDGRRVDPDEELKPIFFNLQEKVPNGTKVR